MAAFAVVIDVDGKQAIVKKLTVATLSYVPLVSKGQTTVGREFYRPGRGKRYPTLKEAQKAASRAKTFTGVEDAQIVYCLLNRFGRPYKR
jgi:hypothetical protein